jgi:ribosome-binding factor A
MKSYKVPRLQEELRKLLNITLTTKIQDPSLAWVTITDVVLSKDLKYAKLYFSHYNNPASHESVKEQLIKTSGYFKKQIAGAHIMRTIPELSFYYDDTEDRAAKVETLLANLKDKYGDEDYDEDFDDNFDWDEDYEDEDDDFFDLDEDEDIFDDIIDTDEDN